MAKRRRRPKAFSMVKAVKANARERVGQPRPGSVIEPTAARRRRQPRHKETLQDLLGAE
jgi:hypothetical protein